MVTAAYGERDPWRRMPGGLQHVTDTLLAVSSDPGDYPEPGGGGLSHSAILLGRLVAASSLAPASFPPPLTPSPPRLRFPPFAPRPLRPPPRPHPPLRPLDVTTGWHRCNPSHFPHITRCPARPRSRYCCAPRSLALHAPLSTALDSNPPTVCHRRHGLAAPVLVATILAAGALAAVFFVAATLAGATLAATTPAAPAPP